MARVKINVAGPQPRSKGATTEVREIEIETGETETSQIVLSEVAELTHNVLLCLQAIREDAQALEGRLIAEYQPIIERIIAAAELGIRMLTGQREPQ